MFRKKFAQWELSPRYLCSCCWSAGPRKGSIPAQKTDSIPAKKTDSAIKSGQKKVDAVVTTPQTLRGCGDGDSLSKAGAAYAYEEETSSDSDDEVLQRFRSSMEQGVKHSSSRYSQRDTASPTARRDSSRGETSSPAVKRDTSQHDTSSPTIKRDTTKESLRSRSSSVPSTVKMPDSVTITNENPPSPKVEKLIDTDSPQHVSVSSSPSVKGSVITIDSQGSGADSSITASITTESTQVAEAIQTYENRAYDGISASESEQVTDEHLFDVSDLQHEAPLISKCGSLEVTFAYDAIHGKMEVTIHQAQEIPAKERGGANNTQVRLLLLPTKKQRHKTKVKQGDNPMFNETLVFNKVSPEEVIAMGIRFRLYGTERMRRQRMIGESIIGFASLNLDMPSTHWVVLEPRSNLSQGDSMGDVSSLSRSDSASSTQSLQHGGMPELLLGLTYNGTTGRLQCEVIKGSNFRNMAMGRAPDTYVKLTLMAPNGSEVAHSKTSVRRGQPNPLFKETFMFQVALFQLADVTLMVSVYNKKSMKKKEMIGWFSLGLNSSGEEESSHWTDMRESKGDNICRWHVLLES